MIPIVNFKDSTIKIIETLRVAASSGCFIVKNSPFSDNNQLNNSILQQLQNFYNLPLQEKINIGTIQGKGATRGYFEMGSESGNKELIELKESFSFGYDTDQIPYQFLQSSNLVDKNIWHKNLDPKQFQSVLEGLQNTALLLFYYCIQSFNLSNEIIDDTSKYQSFCRSFKYHGPHKQAQNIIGNSLHSDWNLLTLVWTDKPGFQFLKDTNDGKRIYEDVFDQDNTALICNFGDFLASQTKGQIKSPWHRVLTPKSGEFRNSLVYFFYPASSFPAERLLGLFVDQSKSDGTKWDIDKNIKTMGQMYSEKWKQVSRKY